MFADLDNLNEEAPPISTAARLAGKLSRLLLIALCIGPVAIFPSVSPIGPSNISFPESPPPRCIRCAYIN